MPLPLNHFSKHAERAAEASGGFFDLAFHEKLTNAGARNRFSADHDRLHLPEKKSVRPSEVFHQARVPFPSAAEMSIMPHADLTNMKFFYEDLFHKIPRCYFSEGRREGLQKTKIDPGLCQIKKFLFDACEHQRLEFWMKNAVRVLGECQDCGQAMMLASLGHHIAQEFLMPGMESVEIPERKNDGPGRTGFILWKVRNDLHGDAPRSEGSLFREAGSG